MAEKGGSRTLREPYGPQTGFEDQRHHRAPSFSISEISYLEALAFCSKVLVYHSCYHFPTQMPLQYGALEVDISLVHLHRRMTGACIAASTLMPRLTQSLVFRPMYRTFRTFSRTPEYRKPTHSQNN